MTAGYSVYVAGTQEYPLPTPTQQTFRRIPVDTAADGATIWSAKAEVTWTYRVMLEAQWTAIKASIGARGVIKFRHAGTVYQGVTDEYQSEVRDRGRLGETTITIAQVVAA